MFPVDHRLAEIQMKIALFVSKNYSILNGYVNSAGKRSITAALVTGFLYYRDREWNHPVPCVGILSSLIRRFLEAAYLREVVSTIVP